VVKPTDTLTLNSAELELTHATAVCKELSEPLTSASLVESNERAEIRFSKVFPAGSSVALRIGYKGTLTDDLLGYYKSTGDEIDGKRAVYALTQFEVGGMPKYYV
jgi:aminopeptidase 2